MTAAEVGGRTRLPNLEVLRGIAALAVLVGHAYGLSGRGVPLSAETFLDGLLMMTPIGVWLFFCLSGLVICQPFVRALVAGTPRPRAAAYAVRRVARIYPLFWVCAAATLVVVGTTGDGPRALLAHLLLLHNLLPGHQLDFIGVTWTLSLEILFYAAVPVLAVVLSRRARGPITPARLARLTVWSAVASIAWMLVGGALSTGSAGLSLYARMLLPSMWSAFCPGILIAVLNVASPVQVQESAILRFVQRVRTDSSRAWAVGGGAAGLGFLSSYAQVEWGMVRYLWLIDLGRVAWCVAFGVLVVRAIDAHAAAARTPRPLVALGEWSYGVYIIHGTVLSILLRYDGGALIPMPHGGAVAFLVHVAFVLAFTLPLSWLSWRLLEQPAMRFARRVQPRPGVTELDLSQTRARDDRPAAPDAPAPRP